MEILILEKKADYITTYSGRNISVLDPQPEDILIDDIAIGLAYCYRFGGHTKTPFTVAQHSVGVMNYVNNGESDIQTCLTALMHDAPEAILGDMKSPHKRYCGGYQELEDILMKAIAEKFGLIYPFPDIIKKADEVEFCWEWATFKDRETTSWEPKFAKTQFLRHYYYWMDLPF